MGKLQWSLQLDRALAEQGSDDDDGDGDDYDYDRDDGDDSDDDNDDRFNFSARSCWPRKEQMWSPLTSGIL